MDVLIIIGFILLLLIACETYHRIITKVTAKNKLSSLNKSLAAVEEDSQPEQISRAILQIYFLLDIVDDNDRIRLDKDKIGHQGMYELAKKILLQNGFRPIEDGNPQWYERKPEKAKKYESGLERFIKAQKDVYDIALQEIRKGKKQGHWMWYIFPQLEGLGCSEMAEHYAIKDSKEAKMYAAHPVLGKRLREITKAVLEIQETDVEQIVGYPDNLKLQSCMTLFYIATEEDLFLNVLEKYYAGQMCEYTEQQLKGEF